MPGKHGNMSKAKKKTMSYPASKKGSSSGKPSAKKTMKGKSYVKK